MVVIVQLFSSELSLEAHPVNNWSQGPSKVLTVKFITVRLSLDTYPGAHVPLEQDDFLLLVYNYTVNM